MQVENSREFEEVIKGVPEDKYPAFEASKVNDDQPQEDFRVQALVESVIHGNMRWCEYFLKTLKVDPLEAVRYFDEFEHKSVVTSPLHMAVKGYATACVSSFPNEMEPAQDLMNLVLRHCKEIPRDVAVRMVEWMGDPHNEHDFKVDISASRYNAPPPSPKYAALPKRKAAPKPERKVKKQRTDQK